MNHTRTLTWISADGTEIPLTTDTEIVTELGPVGLDSPPVDLSTAQRPGGGATRIGRRYSSRTVLLPLIINGRTALNELIDAVVDGSPGRLVHRWDDDRRKDRTLHRVEYVAGLEGDETPPSTFGLSDTHRRTLRLDALDPWWHGRTKAVSFGTPQMNTDWVADRDWVSDQPWRGAAVGISAGQDWNGDRPWVSSALWTGGAVIPMDVTAPGGAWPELEVSGAASSVIVTQIDSGVVVKTAEGFNLDVGDVWELVSDPDAPRDVSRNGVVAWDTITPDSDPDLFVGAGERLAVVVAGTTAETTVTVRWDERFVRP